MKNLFPCPNIIPTLPLGASFPPLFLAGPHHVRQSAIDQNYMFELFVGELPIAPHSAVSFARGILKRERSHGFQPMDLG